MLGEVHMKKINLDILNAIDYITTDSKIENDFEIEKSKKAIINFLREKVEKFQNLGVVSLDGIDDKLKSYLELKDKKEFAQNIVGILSKMEQVDNDLLTEINLKMINHTIKGNVGLIAKLFLIKQNKNFTKIGHALFDMECEMTSLRIFLNCKLNNKVKSVNEIL